MGFLMEIARPKKRPGLQHADQGGGTNSTQALEEWEKNGGLLLTLFVRFVIGDLVAGGRVSSQKGLEASLPLLGHEKMISSAMVVHSPHKFAS
jgi:hypothetical protein